MTTPIVHPASENAGPGIAGALANFRSLNEFRAQTPLPDNAQREFDQAVIDVGRNRLAVVDRLLARGLTYSLPNWLAVPELYWERKSASGNAERTMTPGQRSARQDADRSGVTYPIYATVDGFSFHQRQLLIAERSGIPLDTDHAEQATRNVNVGFEDAAINGGLSVGGNSSPGLLGAPNVNTITYPASEKWDASGKTGAEILTDVQSMAAQNKADKYFGPYELLIPTDYEAKMGSDYVSGYPKTIGDRLRELEFGGEKLVITVCDQLPDDRTVLFQPTKNVIDVVVGQQPTLVSWIGSNPWEFEFAVVGCLIVRVKDDYDGGSGICTGNV